MQMQIQPERPEFAVTRDAVAQVRSITQAAAASYLCTLTATQFERLVSAATAEISADVRPLLLRLAIAENLAEQATAAPPAIAEQLAAQVNELAGEARETIASLTTESAPVAAAGAMDSPSEQDAHAVAPADPPIVAEAASDIESPVPAEATPAK